ncbi:growth/differentiatio [Paramormyrops kingsleyae]|uniref:growth/differentiatio n=1 Tax=Paramormyrops kingsleyae TaxID=1676925 RepID=UPI003B972535
METLIKVLAVLCCVCGTGLSGSADRSAGAANTPEAADPITYYGSILSQKFKALSEHSIGEDLIPRLRPDSRYVRYMKRLYKMSSKQGRDPGRGTSHLYNTVRLITPRDECLEQNQEFFMQDISYNLARVRAQEQLLKSILLYSFDKDQATPLRSVCYLDVKEQEPVGQQLCSSIHHSASFRVRNEKRGRHIWVEVDVTPFLLPLIRSQKKEIHLLINLTCAEDRDAAGSIQGHRGPGELSLRSPSLLLYLNDTSMVAFQRWQSLSGSESFKSPVGSSASPLPTKVSEPVMKAARWRRRVLKRQAARHGPLAQLTVHMPRYEFPTDDCSLYDFRVSFSQLRLDHWIIAPHKYNPRYCKGVCPRAVSSIYGSPVHTMVQNIIYEQLDSSVPRPSCVPSEYSPLSVLIIESDGSIAYKEYEEMIATKCTCR